MTLTSALPSLFSLADQPEDMKKAEFIKSQMAAASNFTPKVMLYLNLFQGPLQTVLNGKLSPNLFFQTTFGMTSRVQPTVLPLRLSLTSRLDSSSKPFDISALLYPWCPFFDIRILTQLGLRKMMMLLSAFAHAQASVVDIA